MKRNYSFAPAKHVHTLANSAKSLLCSCNALEFASFYGLLERCLDLRILDLYNRESGVSRIATARTQRSMPVLTHRPRICTIAIFGLGKWG